MSVDQLQKKIRKMKNPSCVVFSAVEEVIPNHILESADSFCNAYAYYARELLTALKELVPAVRFDFATFAVLGSEGVQLLQQMLAYAAELDYYVILDAPEARSVQTAQAVANQLLNPSGPWKFDGLVLSCYMGSDGLQPYLGGVKEQGKDLFLLLRTANKTAAELQDLMTGSRLVHLAAADLAKRLGEPYVERGGYSRVGGVGAATTADGLRTLRSKYPAMFLLVDGADYSGANAKNCSAAFDKLGHGAVVCFGSSVLAAWRNEETEIAAHTQKAVQAAERARKNLLRYITIL